MKKILCLAGLLILLSGLTIHQASAQNLLDRAKKKVQDATINKVGGTDDQNASESPQESRSIDSNSPANTKSGGLSNTRIDVAQNITDAGKAFNEKKYSDTKYSIRQAILGIELEIGKNILKELPESVAGLPKVESEDNVTSTGIGFVGLVINRNYREEEKEFRITIGNDAAMLSGVNMYLASGAYASSQQEENIKQTKFKEYRAVIEWDESAGYKLSVPFGQSSILVTEGVNFNTEEEFMNASLTIDLELIKKHLGEQ
jgi:hypothetical protein